jgi:hypothetical protein
MVINETEPSIEGGGGEVALASPEYLGGMGGPCLTVPPALLPYITSLQIATTTKKGPTF